MAGTKMSFLDLGRIDADEGYFIRGCGAGTYSNPNPEATVRRVAVIATVIEHPKAGPLLFETGCATNAREEWPTEAWEAFPVTVYEEEHHLDKALEAAGYGVDDIRGVIMGHLHLDHAGGLELFRGTDVPIYVHEKELKEAWYAVATKEDIGAYVPGDLDWRLNWQAISREETELFDGLILRNMPGHTPGLMTAQVDLQNSGTFFLTSDLFHVRDLFEQGLPQGWLARNAHDWWRSYKWIKQLQQKTDATMVYGHDAEVLEELQAQAKFFD
ncbi:MAG: N-acyl homoserine lactonase family protein [Blastococcus sp.]|jgi:glyoxylase-like metal-dependent hydrolase (beta-lactamase superfamily II)|nr:N-acyl homoserine lactonase family protein [Blastococcus sp.]